MGLENATEDDAEDAAKYKERYCTADIYTLNGTFSGKQFPGCFMPLMAGLVPEDRKQRLSQILKDET